MEQDIKRSKRTAEDAADPTIQDLVICTTWWYINSFGIFQTYYAETYTVHPRISPRSVAFKPSYSSLSGSFLEERPTLGFLSSLGRSAQRLRLLVSSSNISSYYSSRRGSSRASAVVSCSVPLCPEALRLSCTDL